MSRDNSDKDELRRSSLISSVKADSITAVHTHGSHGSHSFHRLDSSAHYFPTPRGSYYVKRFAYTGTIKPSGLNSETSCIIKALPTGFARCIKPTRGGAAPPRLDFPSRIESIVNHSSSAGIFVGNHHLRPFDFRRIERKRAAPEPVEKNRDAFAPLSSSLLPSLSRVQYLLT